MREEEPEDPEDMKEDPPSVHDRGKVAGVQCGSNQGSASDGVESM